MQFHHFAAIFAAGIVAAAVAPSSAENAGSSADRSYRARLTPASTTVEAGESIDLRLLRCQSSEQRLCTDEPTWASALAAAAVNGIEGGSDAVGTVTTINDGTTSRVRYRAPAGADGTKPVLVSVELLEEYGARRQVLVATVTPGARAR